LPQFAGMTRDPEGNYYLLFTRQNKDGDFSPNVKLVRYSKDGVETGNFDLPIGRDGGFDVMRQGYTARVLWADGRIAVHMGKTQHKNRGDGLNHQSAIFFVVDALQMTLLEKESMKATASHSFDQRMIFDGSHFVNLDLADNYPRGFHLTKNKKGKVIFTFKTKHSNVAATRGGKRIPAGKWSNDNRTYSELGSLAPAPGGYLVLGASEKSLDNDTAESYLNESRNLFVVLADKDFGEKPVIDYKGKRQVNMVSPEVVISPGAASKIINFYTFGGDIQYQQRRGVVWLTDYSDSKKENAVKPRLVKSGEDRYTVIWEKWTDKDYVMTYGMEINSQGKVLSGPEELGALRINRGDDPVIFRDEMVWVTGNKAKKTLRIHRLTTK
ncbi:MAG: hypothetical protein CVV45_21050, partial [Spirochaetae bacterium HGW-Spirochaetae-10]